MASSQWLYIEQRLSWRARHEGRHCLRWVRPLSYLCPSPPSQTAAKVESLQNSIPHELFSCPLDILQLPSALLAKLLVHYTLPIITVMVLVLTIVLMDEETLPTVWSSWHFFVQQRWRWRCSLECGLKMNQRRQGLLRAGNEGRRECQQHLPHLD